MCSLHIMQSPFYRISKYRTLQTPTAAQDRSDVINDERGKGSCKGGDGTSFRVAIPSLDTPSAITGEDK